MKINIEKNKIINRYLIIALVIISLLSSILYTQSKQTQKDEFFKAIDKGDTNTINKLIKEGIDVNLKDEKGFSALHRAVYENQIDSLKTLLNNTNINIEAKLPKNIKIKNYEGKEWNIDGQTPLHLATFRGYTNAIAQLINKGADILAKEGVDYAMPIHIAAGNGQTDAIKTLLDNEIANNEEDSIINATDGYGTTPLMWATYYGRVPTMNYLIDNGGYLDNPDYEGWRALHYAALAENYGAALALLKAGANANLINNDGYTPYDIAEQEPIQSLLGQYMY